MAVLAIYEPDLRASAQLNSALGAAHDVVVCATWTSLRSVVQKGHIEMCLAPSVTPSTDRAAERFVELRRLQSDLGIVATVDADPVEKLYDLGGLGVDGVVDPNARPARIRAGVDTALATVRARRVRALLAGRLPETGIDALVWALEHVGQSATVERFAAALGHSPVSLRDRLQADGLPGPSRVLLWGRLIQAGARLGTDGRSVEEVAFSLGYATASSLSRAMKLHTDLTPVEVARSGGMEAVVDALVPPPRTRRSSGGGALDGPAQSGGLAFRLAGYLMAALILGGCATSGIDGGAVRSVVDTPPIDQLHVGVLAVDLETGRTLFEHNAHRKFIPASNQKILVTATAMSLLGPDYRFTTEVWSTGPVDGSVVDGDVVVVASGDPTWSDRYAESGTEVLTAMADSLTKRGIRHVAGSAVVDVSAWDSTTVGPTWEVEDLRYRYGSTGGAFAIDEGEIEVVVTGGSSEGAPARIEWSPAGTHDFVRSSVWTAPPDSGTRVRPDYLPESRVLSLEGRAEPGTTDTLTFAMRDPVVQSVAVFERTLHRAGVEVEGGVRMRWTPDEPAGRCAAQNPGNCAGAELLFRMESPPLTEIVAGVLEPSQNWMTEQLVRALGARFGDEGSWSEGIDVIEAWLVNEVGVEPTDIAPRDGSGLSFYNLVTPRALALILRDMHEMPWGPEYRAAMAEPGEEESTLRNRLDGLEGRVFAKTGTISNVNSLSGYLVRDGGQEIVFSILTNGSGMPASRVRSAIDEIVRSLAH